MEKQKRRAAKEACKYVKDGMIIGVGSGSTVKHFIIELGKRKPDIIAIPTSKETQARLEDQKIRIGNINELIPDLAVDGADEVDPKKNLIKGGGGALTREKIIDYRAKKLIIIVDQSKLVQRLGDTHPLPIEVLPFAHGRVRQELERMFEKVEKRDFVTDNGNYILDCYGSIQDPAKTETMLENIPGQVENGLFTKNVWKVIIGTEKGIKEK